MKMIVSLPPLLATLILAGGCKTISDYSVPLPTPFLTNADVYTLKQPGPLLTDKAYEQQSGPFAVSQMDISWVSTEKRTQAPGDSALDTMINLLFADIDQQIFHHTIQQQQEYKFSTSLGGLSTQVYCRLISHSVQQEEIPRGEDKPSSIDGGHSPDSRRAERQHTQLGCVLSQGDSQWQLSLKIQQQQEPVLTLQSAAAQYQLTGIHHSLQKIDNQWQQVPDIGVNFQGLQIRNNQQTLAAMSLSGKTPKVWLSRQLTAEQQTILFAASYSIQMMNWLDRDWRVDQDHGFHQQWKY